MLQTIQTLQVNRYVLKQKMNRKGKIITLLYVNNFLELSYLDDDEDELVVKTTPAKSEPYNKKIEGYEHIIPSFTSEHFKSHFRYYYYYYYYYYDYYYTI